MVAATLDFDVTPEMFILEAKHIVHGTCKGRVRHPKGIPGLLRRHGAGCCSCLEALHAPVHAASWNSLETFLVGVLVSQDSRNSCNPMHKSRCLRSVMDLLDVEDSRGNRKAEGSRDGLGQPIPKRPWVDMQGDSGRHQLHDWPTNPILKEMVLPQV